MIGCGLAFDELDGNVDSQLTVVQAADGFVYITLVFDGKARKFTATDVQANAIAAALKEATRR